MATSAKKSDAPARVVKPIATQKSPSKKTTTKKATQVKTVAPPKAKKVSTETAPQTHLKPSTAPKPTLTTEQRNHYVAVAAFYIAERRGFTLGNPQDDWLAAEAEIDRLIASGHFSY